MKTHGPHPGSFALAAVALGVLLTAMVPACARNQANTDQIPQEVMAGLTARFPDAVIAKWEKEQEDGAVIYDIEFEQAGRKFEADIMEDGTIVNWEKEVTATDLPDHVQEAVAMQYPGAALGEIMAVTSVVDGLDLPEGYEIVLGMGDAESIEIMVTPAGEVVEEDEADED